MSRESSVFLNLSQKFNYFPSIKILNECKQKIPSHIWLITLQIALYISLIKLTSDDLKIK